MFLIYRGWLGELESGGVEPLENVKDSLSEKQKKRGYALFRHTLYLWVEPFNTGSPVITRRQPMP